MHEDFHRLIAMITETVTVLESDGEAHWRVWLIRIRSSLEAGDTYGARELLSGYSGMGSFNDLVLGQATHDGQFAWKPNAAELNKRFDGLRSEMWQLANQIRHPEHGRA
jgi:hypothetical protein